MTPPADWRPPPMKWQLLGPDDDLTPEWLAKLLDAYGTVEDWRAIGLPLATDAHGVPAPFVVWGRTWSLSAISDDELADYRLCGRCDVVVPTPLPADEP